MNWKDRIRIKLWIYNSLLKAISSDRRPATESEIYEMKSYFDDALRFKIYARVGIVVPESRKCRR